MKRSAKIYMLLLVWISAALQFFINDRLDISETLAQVSNEDETIQTQTTLCFWGVYSDSLYTDQTAEKIVTNTGAHFGLASGSLSMLRLPSGKCFRFSGKTGSYSYQIDLILDQDKECSYLVLYTDNAKNIRAVRTFYTKLNIDYHMTINITCDDSELDMLYQ